MTLPLSDPHEEEMLRRARILVETRGKRVDRGDHDWFWTYRSGRLHLSIRECDDKVSVSLKLRDKPGVYTIYYIDLDHDIGANTESIFMFQHYKECVDLMEGLMILDDIANV